MLIGAPRSLATSRRSFLLSPRRSLWRRVLFQVHLWIGLLATVYICLIGITGSILVFGHELYALSRPALFRPLSPAPPDLTDRVPAYLAAARKSFPGVRFSEVYLPMDDQPTLQVQGEPEHSTEFNQYLVVYLDPASGKVLGTTDSHFWVSWLRELHVRLLAGRMGAVINGCGASCLLLLALTGLIIWWPGLAQWSRGMRVNFRRRLSRINYDLHSAVGFWSLLFLLLWSVSGIYFSWPDQFVAALDLFVPAKSAAFPNLHIDSERRQKRDLLALLADAQRAVPHARLLAVTLPSTKSDPLTVIVSQARHLDRSTYVFYNPFSGERLAMWERGPGATLGTQIIYWLMPLHFGESWGLLFKTVWFLFGLSLPALAITGKLMYWNRFLRKQVKQHRSTPPNGGV